jgi:type IV pilus assembly protein PilP
VRILRWALSYILMSVSAVAVAFYLTSALMSRSHAQSPTSAPPQAQPQNQQQPRGGSPGTSPSSPPGNPATNPPPPSQAPGQPPAAGGPATGAVPEALLEESAPVQQTAIQVNPEDFVFDPTGIRDPFKPYKAVKPPEHNGAIANVTPTENLDPLQSVDIEMVELVAVLWDVKNPRALIRTKGGTTYTIKRDTKIGRNNGVVAGIREGEVIVLESFEEDGRPFKQYTSIKMAGKDIKKPQSSSN